MPGRAELTESNAVDIGKRYDIYVAETQSRVVVYRNAFFRGLKELEEERTRYFRWSDFVENRTIRRQQRVYSQVLSHLFLRRRKEADVRACHAGGITPHCNGPAGRNGPCDSNAARRPAGR